jgi:hypothetical protein
MFDVGESLRKAFESARDRLHAAASAVASANAGRRSGRSTDAAMAEVAEAALFSEVLISSERARLTEIKSVAK